MIPLYNENHFMIEKPTQISKMMEKRYPQEDKVTIHLGNGWEIGRRRLYITIIQHIIKKPYPYIDKGNI